MSDRPSLSTIALAAAAAIVVSILTNLWIAAADPPRKCLDVPGASLGCVLDTPTNRAKLELAFPQPTIEGEHHESLTLTPTPKPTRTPTPSLLQ